MSGQATIYRVGDIQNGQSGAHQNSSPASQQGGTQGYPQTFQQALLNYAPPSSNNASTSDPSPQANYSPQVDVVTATPTFPPAIAFIPNAGMGGGFYPCSNAVASNPGMLPFTMMTTPTTEIPTVGGPYPIGNSYLVPQPPPVPPTGAPTNPGAILGGNISIPFVKKTPSKWTIKLLSGYNISRPSTEDNKVGFTLTNTNVKVTLHDFNSDDGTNPTVYVSGHPKKWMGKNPVWNDERGFVFENIKKPSAASILFSIWDHELSSDKETFMAAASIPLSSMVKGKHNIPLFKQENFNQTGQSFSTLFIDVDIVE